MPWCLGTSGSVRVTRIAQRASCAMDVQTFWPLTTQSSPSRTARVASAARSEPAPGSQNSWHQTSSPVHSGRSQRCFCSSVPNPRMVGAAMPSPMPMRRGLVVRRAGRRERLLGSRLQAARHAEAAEALGIVEPGQAGVEAGPEEVESVGGAGVMGGQEILDATLEVVLGDQWRHPCFRTGR